MNPIWGVLLGGLFAIVGGYIATASQTRFARERRMEEVIAEKKVAANSEAYSRIKRVSSLMVQSTIKETFDYMAKNEVWLFDNRLFLPGKFPDKWLTIRNGLSKALRLEQQLPSTATELSELEGKLSKIATEAGNEIYKEMKLSPIEVEL